VIQSSEGGYIIVGYTHSFSGASFYNVYLIKTNREGNQTWFRIYGERYDDRGYSVQQTSDGSYIIVGFTDVGNNYDVYLLKKDENGNLNWSRTFGGSGNDFGSYLQKTSDDGYIITGRTSSFGTGASDVYLIKTDANGNPIWDRTFGGSNYECGYSVQQTSDSGYIIAGYTDSFGAGNNDVYLIKTDSTGNPTWERTIGGAEADEGFCVQKTSDGGYTITGRTQSFGLGYWDVYLIKTDSNGNQIWERTLGGAYWDEGHCVQQTSDGGYIIAGVTSSFGPPDPNLYLIKVDENGNLTWYCALGGSSWDEGFSVLQISDGGYIAAGRTSSFGTGSFDAYLIKTAPETVVNQVFASRRIRKFYTLRKTSGCTRTIPTPAIPSP
jgi:hypothetical protein